MSFTIDDITNTTRQHTKKMVKLIQPLNQFGITYFAWQKITFDGQWSMVCSHPRELEYSIENQFYQVDPILVDPEKYQSGICYLNTHSNIEFQKKLIKRIKHVFDLGHPLTIIERTSEGCEFAVFATHARHTNIINTYITQIHSLRSFAEYFKSENKLLIEQANDFQIDLKHLKKDAFYSDDVMKISSLEENASFRTDNDIILSPRQKECLQYFLSGKTAKETALLLKLSHRTIEKYFENIKKKVGCLSKRQLLKIFK